MRRPKKHPNSCSAVEKFDVWSRSWKWLTGTCLIICASGAVSRDVSTSQADDGFASSGQNWAYPGGGVNEGNYSSLTQVNTQTISKLGLAWSADLFGEQTLEATPLAVNGVLYFSGSRGDVYALDARTGKLRWKFDARVGEHLGDRMLGFPANRGVAYWQGKIFVGTFDGRLIALDVASGRQIWSVQTFDIHSKRAITGAPRVFKGKVVIGNSGADFGERGYLTAYDANTGKLVWRFYTVPGRPDSESEDPVMKMAAKTWSGRYWETGTGGTVWDSVTYDPELDRLYIGTGNSGPYDPAVRSPGDGDNLFLTSIVAVNPDTGKYIWHYQVNPREAWDFKATSAIIATTLVIDGKPRKVLMQSPTNGFFYVIDRVTGKLISAEKTGKVTWASHIDLQTGRPVEAAGIRYDKGPVDIWPSPWGTHNWQRMSYNPTTGLVYIPYMQIGSRFATVPGIAGTEGFGGHTSIDPVIADKDDGTGALTAWDPIAQKPRWKVAHPTLWNGGTVSTAGGLVFQGTAEGRFNAYDGKSGKLLWQFEAGQGIVSAPITYSVRGKQYVSVLAGYGGGTAYWSKYVFHGWKYREHPRRMLTFVLDGKAKLPPTPPADSHVRAIDDPALKIDPHAAKKGEAIYNSRCMVCHGGDLLPAGNGPDLRESDIALSLESFDTVVRKGALLGVGMPRFSYLSDADVHALYSYIRDGARKAQAKANNTHN